MQQHAHTVTLKHSKSKENDNISTSLYSFFSNIIRPVFPYFKKTKQRDRQSNKRLCHKKQNISLVTVQEREIMKSFERDYAQWVSLKMGAAAMESCTNVETS